MRFEPGRSSERGFDVPCASSRSSRLVSAAAAVLLLSVPSWDLKTLWVNDDRGNDLAGRFIHTGHGAHGIYPDREGRRIFLSNRDGGSVSVLDASSLAIIATWKIPGGGLLDMGGVTADGSQLWLSGRYNSEVYVFDTSTGAVIKRITVNAGPHGLLVWPQPGSFSLGHTGNMR
jgi:YVTN family beta-propeller protein